MDQFEQALVAYREASIAAQAAEEAYRLAHAKALLASDGKNEGARKADADAATSDLRAARSVAALEAELALHRVQYLKARAGVAA